MNSDKSRSLFSITCTLGSLIVYIFVIVLIIVIYYQGFLDRMSGPLVQAHCQDYSADPDICPILLSAQESVNIKIN